MPAARALRLFDQANNVPHRLASILPRRARDGTWSHELDVAVSVVTDAAILAREIQDHVRHEAILKPDQSPVTIADFAVQAFVADRLAREFPADTLVAEEDATSLRGRDADRIVASILASIRRLCPDADADRVLAAIDRGAASPSDRFWTLDPIDGTEGFLRNGQYVVALALVVRGRVEVGVLGCPRLSVTSRGAGAEPGGPSDAGSVAFSMRGHGAFATPLTGGHFTPLHVSDVREPRVTRVLRSRAWFGSCC
jgi:3'(2'), 5'-bisphosphate nucleotidase